MIPTELFHSISTRLPGEQELGVPLTAARGEAHAAGGVAYGAPLLRLEWLPSGESFQVTSTP